MWELKNKRPTWCHLLFYFTSYGLNMFRTLIYPSSGACDYSVELPHWSYCSWFDVWWSFGVVGLEWYPCCRLLMMDILMSETCWAHKKWNKIASDIKLVFYSSIFLQLGNSKALCALWFNTCTIVLVLALYSWYNLMKITSTQDNNKSKLVLFPGDESLITLHYKQYRSFSAPLHFLNLILIIISPNFDFYRIILRAQNSMDTHIG